MLIKYAPAIQQCIHIYLAFLHGRSWNSPWIKSISISNELGISFHALAWQLPSPIMRCASNVTSSREESEWDTELAPCARNRSVKIATYELILFRVRIIMMQDLWRRTVYAFTGVLFWYLIPSLFRNWGNRPQYMAAYKTCNFIGMSLPDHHIILRRQWQIITRHVTLLQPHADQ